MQSFKSPEDIRKLRESGDQATPLNISAELAQKKLKELGITKDASTVMQIVRLLKKETPQHQIYNGSDVKVSNNTVLRIKKLWDAGDLDWMNDELDTILNEMVKTSAEDEIDNVLSLLLNEWGRPEDDGLGRFRLDIVGEAETALEDRQWEWSIGNLERIGFPSKDALAALQEYDRLHMDRVSAVVDGIRDDEFYAYMKKFRGFDEYLALLHKVYLMLKYPNSLIAPIPTASMSLARKLYTRGVLEADDSISTAGEDILRYQVWRKGDHLKAYYKSLTLYKRTPKRNKELRSHITALLKGTDDE